MADLKTLAEEAVRCCAPLLADLEPDPEVDKAKSSLLNLAKALEEP